MKLLLPVLSLSTVLLAASASAADSKPPAPAEKPAATAPATAAGTWHLQVETSRGTGTPTFTFKQEGENLTGQYKGLFGEAPVTGTLKGAEITFSIRVQPQGRELTITYTGTIDGDNMKGKVSFGGPEDSFTGKRAAN